MNFTPASVVVVARGQNYQLKFVKSWIENVAVLLCSAVSVICTKLQGHVGAQCCPAVLLAVLCVMGEHSCMCFGGSSAVQFVLCWLYAQ